MRADGLSQGGKSCFCGNAPAISSSHEGSNGGDYINNDLCIPAARGH